MGLRSCRGQAHGDGCGATTSVGDHEVLRVLAGCSQYHHELIMLVKLAGPRGCPAAKHWRSLDGAERLIEAAKDTKFQDGQILNQAAD